MKLHVIQAKFGDCFLLECGEEGTRRFILVDGGPSKTYHKHLKYALSEIIPQQGQIDLVVLTHVDNDHICGILELLEDMKQNKSSTSQGFTIRQLWHNTFEQNIGITSDISLQVLDFANQVEKKGLSYIPSGDAWRGIAQGDQATRLANELGIPINDGFDRKLVLTDDATAPRVLGDIKLIIIGPNIHNLQRLQEKWYDWLKKQSERPITRGEIDTSIPNLSSIMFLAQEGGKKILFTGDGTGRDILEGLKAAGKLDSSGRIHVDVLKLPHHGSKRNMSEDFFNYVTADLYVISADGQNNNPEYETLEWIVRTTKQQGRRIKILATKETDSLKQLVQTYDHVAYAFDILYLEVGKDYITV